MDSVAFKKFISYIIYSNALYIWTLPNIYVYITYPWKKIKVNYIVNTFILIPLSQKLQLRQGFKLLKRLKKDINIVSNLFFDFFIRLTWHHSSYNHIPIHYNHEIVNVIKIQNSHL
jgi:hypothetical protein